MAELHGEGAWRVFFSYCHDDDNYRQKIDEHLSLLRRQGLISSWYDHKITAGKDLDAEIAQELDRAHIILLLISSAFIGSEYCYCRELEDALKRHEAGTARVVPVILRPCDWKTASFARLKALPQDAKPVTKWGNRDDAYLDIATGIREVIKDFNTAGSTADGKEKTGPSPRKPDVEDRATLSARLSLGGELILLARIGCPYLMLRLICTSMRPAKIAGAELRLRGSNYLKAFQAGFGTDFGHTPVPGGPAENDSFGIQFLAMSEPNLPEGFRIEQDEACTFLVPGLGFPLGLFANAESADLSIVAKFLDGHTEVVKGGDELKHQLSGLLGMCTARPYTMHPMLTVRWVVHVASQTAGDVSAVGTTNKHAMVFGHAGQGTEHSATSSSGMDIFQDFPELTSIGQEALQANCDEWLKTSIARQSHVKTVTIGKESNGLVIADVGMEAPPDIQDGELLHFPLDYLLYFLIDRIASHQDQERLKTIVAIKRLNGGPSVYQQFKVAPRKRLGVKCKNPACQLTFITQVMGYPGRPFMTEIEPETCPRCGAISWFQAKDFFAIPDHVAQQFSPDTGPAPVPDQPKAD